MLWKKLKTNEKKSNDITINISTEKCTGCGKCFLNCKNGVFEIKYGYSYWAYPFDCTGCGRCESICTQDAIKIIKKSEFSNSLILNTQNV